MAKLPWAYDDILPRRGPRAGPDQGSLRAGIDAAMAAFGEMRVRRTA